MMGEKSQVKDSGLLHPMARLDKKPENIHERRKTEDERRPPNVPSIYSSSD